MPSLGFRAAKNAAKSLKKGGNEGEDAAGSEVVTVRKGASGTVEGRTDGGVVFPNSLPQIGLLSSAGAGECSGPRPGVP